MKICKINILKYFCEINENEKKKNDIWLKNKNYFKSYFFVF